jgi:hypothetical protein
MWDSTSLYGISANSLNQNTQTNPSRGGSESSPVDVSPHTYNWTTTTNLTQNNGHQYEELGNNRMLIEPTSLNDGKKDKGRSSH